jgi:serine/threonine protein kinase
MEYVHGSSLREEVQERGPLDIRRAVHLIHQAALGLHHVHEAGLLPENLEPGQLLVDRWGTLKICELGEGCFTAGGALAGSKAPALEAADFVAPE